VASERFVVREAIGPGWDWLPDWLVIDTVSQVRAAAYNDKGSAVADAAERNAGEESK
jgi:hypothetical protein